MIAYRALFRREPPGYFVRFPDFEHGAATQGETLQQAIAMAEDLLACLIADYAAEGRPLPAPRPYRGTHYRLIQATGVAPSARVYRP